MLDSRLRPFVTPSLDKIAEKIDSHDIPANVVTVAGLVIGLVGCFCIAIQSYLFGLIFIVTSRVLSGIDGALARRQGITDFGAYLNALCDALFYGAFAFFFVMTLPPNEQFPGLFLLISLIALIASHLAYERLAENGTAAYSTSRHTMASLIENTEILLFMIAACLLPEFFPLLAYLLGVLCWLTAIGRSMKAWYLYGKIALPPMETEQYAGEEDSADTDENSETV